eukprot:g40506.t1
MIKTFDPVLQSTLRNLILHTSHVRDFYCLLKIHKVSASGRPIISGSGTLCENLSGYVKGILKPIMQGTPSFHCNTIDFLRKLSTHGPIRPGTFLLTMNVSALYVSFPHDDGIAATASVVNATNCQFPDAILQLINFILDHNVFTFDNQFFIKTHGTAMGTRFALHYAKCFMHKFEQDFFAAEDLRQSLYTSHVDSIFFLWTNVSFLDTYISIKNRHLRTYSTASPQQTTRLQDNINHNTIKHCHGNFCKTCQIIDMDTTITHGNNTLHVHGRNS